MHNVFHVFVLIHDVSDHTHVIDMTSLHVSDEGSLMTDLIHILNYCIQQLQCRIVNQVNVHWDNYSPHSAT